MPAASPPDIDTPPPAALTAALVVVTVEVCIQLAALFASLDDPDDSGFGALRNGVGGVMLLASAILAKLVFAWRTRQRKAGSALGLLALESVGLLVALSATPWSAALRLGLVAVVIVVFALVLSSLSTFPAPELPDFSTERADGTHVPPPEHEGF